MEHALEQTRARQLELSRKNALEPSGQEQLATVDLMLATVYRNNGKSRGRGAASSGGVHRALGGVLSLRAQTRTRLARSNLTP